MPRTITADDTTPSPRHGPHHGPDASTAPSCLVWTLGRGIHGKSFWVRLIADELRNAGRPVTVVDADRNNATLTSYLPDTVRPASAEDADVEDCVRAVTEDLMAAAQPTTVVMDFGANDLTLKRISRKLGGFDTYLADGGVRAVAIHFLGVDPDDLALLHDMEAGVFAPAATALVLNQALLPPGGPLSLFDPVMAHPVFTAATARGAVPLFMPRLEPEAARLLNQHRLTANTAIAGQGGPDGSRIGPWYRTQIKAWRNTMLQNHQPIMGWLR